MIDRGDAFIASLDIRVSEILDRCTRCARCVEVCPTAGPAGIDTREPAAIVGDVLDILRGGGDAASRGARWAQSCTGSGRCLSACDDGVNPRFMLAATRLKLNQRRAVKERHATGQAGFQKMSEAVKVLSRVQLPAELLARITRSARADSEGTPDVVMYLGCNVLKTPHIALLCLEVLNRIGARILLFGCSLCATRVQPQEDMLSSLPIPGACVPYSDIGEQRSTIAPNSLQAISFILGSVVGTTLSAPGP